MTFEKKNYLVVREAVSKELADFIFKYLTIKSNAIYYLKQNKLMPHEVGIFGHWRDKQIPNSYSCYADWGVETLLIKLLPLMKEKTGLDLVPTYSYCRLYKKGDILKKHKDRPSCEISTTVHLGGDEWDIYLDGVQVKLKQGDMLIYKGCDLEHWRDALEGKICCQGFLHYNDRNGQFKVQNAFDGRPIPGVPKL